MPADTLKTRASGTTPIRSNAFMRGLIEGAAGLFDIFGVGATQRRSTTPEDDARELRSDVDQIAQDFRVVLSGIEAGSKK